MGSDFMIETVLISIDGSPASRRAVEFGSDLASRYGARVVLLHVLLHENLAEAMRGLSEVERSLIQERTRESVEHRRQTGGNLGGRPKTSDKKQSLVLRLRKEGESYRSIREQTGLALATITRIVKEQEAAQC